LYTIYANFKKKKIKKIYCPMTDMFKVLVEKHGINGQLRQK